MNVEIEASKLFSRELKKLVKKFPSLKTELKDFKLQIFNNPTSGDKVFKNTYKTRLAVKSKGKGKSGGLRVITHLIFKLQKDEKTNTTKVFLLKIYDKSELENIDDKTIKLLIKAIRS